VGVTEVDVQAGAFSELGVLGHFGALVPGQRPADLLGQSRDRLDYGAAYRFTMTEYLVLSEDGTVRYFSWEGRQFEYAGVTFMAADAMTRGLDPEAMMEDFR